MRHKVQACLCLTFRGRHFLPHAVARPPCVYAAPPSSKASTAQAAGTAGPMPTGARAGAGAGPGAGAGAVSSSSSMATSVGGTAAVSSAPVVTASKLDGHSAKVWSRTSPPSPVMCHTPHSERRSAESTSVRSRVTQSNRLKLFPSLYFCFCSHVTPAPTLYIRWPLTLFALPLPLRTLAPRPLPPPPPSLPPSLPPAVPGCRTSCRSKRSAQRSSPFARAWTIS